MSADGDLARDPAARLREIDWSALDGIGADVAAALAPVLGGASAERTLDRFLRAHRGFTSAQRAASAWALFGVALWRRRLAAALGLTWDDARASRDLPQRAAELLAVLLRDLGGIEDALACAWCEVAMLAPAPAPRTRPTAERCSLPDWLWAQLVAALGEADAAAYAESISLPGPICLRANRLRTDRESLRGALGAERIDCAPAPHARDGLLVRSPRPNLLASSAARAGLFEAQDEGSQLLGELLEAQPGETVIDLCAGAGGKSLQLAAAVGARGRVLCCDIDAPRLERLRIRAQRAGASAIEVCELNSLPGSFVADRVLVDAPCSELGPLRRGPDARWRLAPASFAALPALQGRLLDEAARRVRPGGRLVYATCTVRREENEEVAERFERDHPAFRRAQPGAGWLDESFVHQRFFHALPHRHGTDGFFAAVWDRAPAM